MDTKPFWASKTMWVNVVALVASLTVGFGIDLGFTAAVQAEIVGGVMAVVNIILRFMTNGAVTPN